MNSVGSRICNKCLVVKPLNEFHRCSVGMYGRYSICKVCKNCTTRKYFTTDNGRKARVRANKRYYSTNKGKKQKAKDQRIYVNKYPEKHLAHSAVAKAIERGDLPHISERLCRQCGASANHYHHYKGYKRGNRLAVIPLCFDCHLVADEIR